MEAFELNGASLAVGEDGFDAVFVTASGDGRRVAVAVATAGGR